MSSYLGQISADGMWRWDGASWQPIASGATHQQGPSWLDLNVKATPTWLALAGALIAADPGLRSAVEGAVMERGRSAAVAIRSMLP